MPKGLISDTDSTVTRDKMTFNVTNKSYFDDILKTDSSLAKDEIDNSQEATSPLLNNNPRITDYMDETFRDNDDHSETGNFINDLRSENDTLFGQNMNNNNMSALTHLVEYSKRHIQKVVVE